MAKTSDYESRIIKKWKTALAQPPKPYVRQASRIPPSFTLVSKAGSGISADAFFCLPKDAETTTQAPEPDEFPARASRLMAKLQVVKVSFPTQPNFMAKEIAFLEAIKQQRPEHESTFPFFELTGFDTAGYWYTTSTLPMCCDLSSLLGSFKYMPEEFMWLAFLQICKALGFLHRICDPPIAHADLHIRNVVIGYPTPTDQGLPEIKLIDFGFSEYVPVKAKDMFPIKQDTRGLLKIMDCIIHDYAEWNRDSCDTYLRCGAPEARSSTFHGFHKAINDGLTAYDSISSLTTFSKQFGPYAARKVASMPYAAEVQIRDAVRRVTYPCFESMEAKVQKLLT